MDAYEIIHALDITYLIEKDLVKFLINKKADVNAKEPSGWSALMFASMLGETESVKMLIAAGADVHSKTNE